MVLRTFRTLYIECEFVCLVKCVDCCGISKKRVVSLYGLSWQMVQNLHTTLPCERPPRMKPETTSCNGNTVNGQACHQAGGGCGSSAAWAASWKRRCRRQQSDRSMMTSSNSLYCVCQKRMCQLLTTSASSLLEANRNRLCIV